MATASPEMERFSMALKGVLSVSKDDLSRILAEEKQNAQPRKAGRKAKSPASDLASADKG